MLFLLIICNNYELYKIKYFSEKGHLQTGKRLQTQWLQKQVFFSFGDSYVDRVLDSKIVDYTIIYEYYLWMKWNHVIFNGLINRGSVKWYESGRNKKNFGRTS